MRKILGISTFLLMTLIIAGMVSAGTALDLCTLTIMATKNTGQALTYVSDSVNVNGPYFNITVNNAAMDCNVTNITVTLTSAKVNRTEVLTTETVNTTKGIYKLNVSTATDRILDANDYTLSAVVVVANGTETSNATTYTQSASNTTALTVDYVKTDAATGLTPATAAVDADGRVTFIGTVEDTAGAGNTSRCLLLFSNDNGKPVPAVSSAMTLSGTTCTASNVMLPMTGAGYKWYIRTSDDTNSTDTALMDLTVETSGNAAKAYIVAQQNQQAAKNSNIVWIVLIGGAAYLLLKKKK